MELQFLLDNNLLELNKVSLLGGCVLWLTIVATISHFVSMKPHYPLYCFLPSPVRIGSGEGVGGMTPVIETGIQRDIHHQ